MRLDRRGIGIGKETNLTAAVADAGPQKPDTTVASSASPRPCRQAAEHFNQKNCNLIVFFRRFL